ncbi:calcium and integrin-binding protein 1-like [Galleria mellonella]|uniref:Calcium and integrin-binding protein 1-like n=1 Tax=Galleria mellonella TaxID=7137 RepID=A0A6J3C283_GALME|nr:calcium and integrin-binding protein 1-like [Galleria mellonella]
MGANPSHPELTEDVLDEYSALTYLRKEEILYLMDKFQSIDVQKVQADYHHRFNSKEIINKFDVLKNNPFVDRIFHVFSSKKDDCFSFEDLLDLYSVMSPECPPEVKAIWAFHLFDLDDDNEITYRDVMEIIDRLTNGFQNPNNFIGKDFKKIIFENILKEVKLDNSNSIGLHEMVLILSRLPEFKSTFYFRL